MHDHRPPEDAKASALSPSHLARIANYSSSIFSQSSTSEPGPSTQPSALTSRALGGNYGFFRRMGLDARSRHGGDPSSLAGGAQGPNVYRVVLYPTAETLWSDLRSLNESKAAGLWSDEDALQVESRILVRAPRCVKYP